MRSLFVSLLSLAACARAQSILGTYYIPSDGNGVSGIVPDVSVIGVHTITDSLNDNGDVTVPNPTTTTEPACVLPLVALSICVFSSLDRFGLFVGPLL